MMKTVRNGSILARGALLCAVLLPLGACESGARQDSLLVRGTTSASLSPASRTVVPPIVPAGADTYTRSAPDSPVAYERPPSPSYPDRPLSENLASSLEVADYVHGLEQTGLFAALRRAGPYTVFAIPNVPLEQSAARWPSGGLNAPASQPVLRQLLAYTIVPGRWDEASLRRAIAKAHGAPVALRTLAGMNLMVTLEQGSGQLVLANAAGVTNRLWFVSAAQSNGTLYFTQGVLPPA